MRAEFHFLVGVLAMIIVSVAAPALSVLVIIATFLSVPLTVAAERLPKPGPKGGSHEHRH